jgi:hypothetical protein
MAVELAKLSLWLDSFTLGAPLSFLDHHLKCGNSLIGIFEISDVIIPGSESYGKVQRALSFMLQVSDLTDATISEAQKSYALFKNAQQEITPIRRRFDVSIAKHFSDLGGNIGYLENLAYTLKFDKEPFPENIERCKKALHIAEEKKFFHWRLEFPEVFYTEKREKENPGFDCVIGNPPYGLINEKNYFKTNFAATSQNYDIYSAFIEQGIKLLKKQGFHSYIVPTSWQTGTLFESLRDILLSKIIFKNVINLPFNVFQDAYIDTGVFVLQKEPQEKHKSVSVYEFPKYSKIDTLDAIEYSKIDQYLWHEANKRIVLDEKAISLIKKLSSSNIISLGSLTKSTRGVLAKPDHILAEEKYDSQPFFDGEMFRYEITSPDKFIVYSDDLPESPSSFDFFTGQRLLIRRIVSRQDRLMAHAVTEPFVNKKDIYIFKPIEKKALNYLLSVLNSKLLSYLYFRSDIVAQKDDFRQTTLEGVRNLPIPRISFTTPKKERKEFFKEAIKLYNGSEYEDILKWAEYEFALKRNDTVHDFLAYLAEQMIEMNKKKNEETKGFLKWLEREIGAEIDTLTNKTAIKEYHDNDFKHLLDVLKKNKNKISVDPTNRKIQETLERHFNESLCVLRPLKGKIRATDNLIDQIVYALYGLTPEEIEIVEGKK